MDREPEAETTVPWRTLQLLLLAFAAFAVTYGRYTLGPLQETMGRHLSLTDNQMAWLQGPAVAVPMAMMAIPIGLIVNRFSRLSFFVFFTALALAATVLTALAKHLEVLFIARCLLGCSVTAILVAAYAAVAELYAPEQRGRATMVVAMGETAGAPAAFALGGALLAMNAPLFHGLPWDSWRWALLCMCAPLAMVTFLMLLLRESPRAKVLARESSPPREVWKGIWSHRSLLVPLFVARIMVWTADGAVLVWGAPTFARGFNLPPERIGAIMGTVLLISGIAGPLLAGPLADLCQRTGGPRRTITALCAVALLTVPTALFPVMPQVGAASVALGVFLTLGFLINTAALPMATIVIPAELRGMLVALSITIGALFCYGVAPLLVSGLSGVLGGPQMIGKALAIVCAVTSLSGAVIFGLSRRHFPARIFDRPALGHA